MGVGVGVAVGIVARLALVWVTSFDDFTYYISDRAAASTQRVIHIKKGQVTIYTWQETTHRLNDRETDRETDREIDRETNAVFCGHR